MPCTCLRLASLCLALVATSQLDLIESHTANAGGRGPHPHSRHSRRGDLFYNFYAYDHMSQSGVPAQLYTTPLPVPARTGHTYYTYQPLMPHEYLYPHRRDYWSSWPGGSWSHTKVKYQARPQWFPGKKLLGL